MPQLLAIHAHHERWLEPTIGARIFEAQFVMPLALKPPVEGYSFYFWSEEGSEPAHVHVSKGDGNAKWWISPEIKEAYSYGFKKQERKRI